MFVIPNKIKIGWKNYDIRHCEECLNSGDELFGQIDYQQCIITLREKNTSMQNECTLIHEALHGISEMYGLDLSEDTVTRLANALFTFLFDNETTVKKSFGFVTETMAEVRHK